MGKQSAIITQQAVLSADPSSPPAGYAVVYPKSDGKWYAKDSAGVITEITNDAGSSLTVPIVDADILSASTWNAKENALTFSTGLTRATNTITSNIFTGVSGGQTIIGSTSTTSGLTYKATTGVGTTGADHIFQVGSNGAIEAMRITSSGFVGIGVNPPLYLLHVVGAGNNNSFVVEAPDITSKTAFALENLPLSTSATTGKAFQIKVTGEATGRACFYSDGKYSIGDGVASLRDVYLSRSAVSTFRITSDGVTGAGHLHITGNLGVGVTTPSGRLHLAAGTATFPPFRMTSGTLLTTALGGAIEFLTDAFYGTITTGAARKTFAFLESPTFTGTPTLPTGTVAVTQSVGNNTTALATTAFVLANAAGSTYMPTYSRVTGSDFANAADASSTTLKNITGLTFAAAANTVYEFEAVLSVSSGSTTGHKYGVNYSTAGSTVEGQIIGSEASVTAASAIRMTALNTGYGTFIRYSTASGSIFIKGILTTGANTGNFTIMTASVSTFVASTTYINSYLKVTKVA